MDTQLLVVPRSMPMILPMMDSSIQMFRTCVLLEAFQATQMIISVR
jgi:hypothetical protein